MAAKKSTVAAKPSTVTAKKSAVAAKPSAVTAKKSAVAAKPSAVAAKPSTDPVLKKDKKCRKTLFANKYPNTSTISTNPDSGIGDSIISPTCTRPIVHSSPPDYSDQFVTSTPVSDDDEEYAGENLAEILEAYNEYVSSEYDSRDITHVSETQLSPSHITHVSETQVSSSETFPEDSDDLSCSPVFRCENPRGISSSSGETFPDSLRTLTSCLHQIFLHLLRTMT